MLHRLLEIGIDVCRRIFEFLVSEYRPWQEMRNGQRLTEDRPVPISDRLLLGGDYSPSAASQQFDVGFRDNYRKYELPLRGDFSMDSSKYLRIYLFILKNRRPLLVG
ncbi:uncharacterized protein LOC135168788 [Diachasmimorpha longicaudata]|uniref:uncharacterized protein LOC135168788 n=1 Tax=Diachasmimorpha longicaudata TaxID=58733 RepID=UPI0030B8CBF7